jgi:ankyrin repeat protein
MAYHRPLLQYPIRQYCTPIYTKTFKFLPMLYTMLQWAAASGCEAVVQQLVEKGANIKAKMTTGETALHVAAENGHEAIMRLLLEKEAVRPN